MDWCQACNQGWVRKAQVIKTGEIIFICEECDSTWPDSIELIPGNGYLFRDYVSKDGLKGLWTELNLLDKRPEEGMYNSE